MHINQNMSDKEKITLVIVSLLMAIIGGFSGWSYLKIYVFNLFIPSLDLIGDPTYIMSLFFGACLFLGGFILPFTIVQTYLWIHKKTIFRLAKVINAKYFRLCVIALGIMGGGFASVSNIILLHKIIPDNGYVLCPKKIGYKKNLLRDYVLDPGKCERF
ncbi:TPA: hypothetical protein ACX6QO_001913 [Photobacterium damselae]